MFKKILIADDHISVREGLTQIIESVERMQVVKAVDNGADLLSAVTLYKPDLVITDVRMPEMDGVDAGAIIKERFPTMGLIAYINDENDFLFLQLLKAGFEGIVLKRAGKKEMIHVMEEVLKGNESYCNAAEERINQLVRKKLYNPKRRQVRPILTERELEVLRFICLGLTSRQIAHEMLLSERTIESYRETLLEKTEATNTAGLVSFAYVNGIIRG
ncbi:MAG: response regulator transcription factor [Ferruginibacter sp.]